MVRISILVVFYIIPEISWACSVCGGALSEEKADAYLVITVMLAFMPLLMLGIFGFWIFSRYKKQIVSVPEDN